MNQRLFEDKTSLTILKRALNVIGRRDFPSAVGYWLRGIGYGDEHVAIEFPEDDDIFEGVRAYYLDEEVIVSEDEFFTVLKEACQRYVELRPDRKDELEQIISQSSLR